MTLWPGVRIRLPTLSMRIVSWNMNRRGVSAKAHQDAWQFLRDDLQADVALVQEAIPPPEFQAQVYSSTGLPGYNWGSAVVALRADLSLRGPRRAPLVESIPAAVDEDTLPESHPGGSAVAEISLQGRQLVTGVSLYGQWEAMPGGKKYLAGPRVHRTLSDLTGVFMRSRQCPVVLAGDFNVTTQGERSPWSEASAVFARLAAWRMSDALTHKSQGRPRLTGCECPDGDACAHVQTFRTGSQLDYCFVSEALLPSIATCSAVATEVAWKLSDHCPIVLDLEDSATLRQTAHARA